MIGLAGLERCGALGRGRTGRLGYLAAVAGMILLTVTEAVAISAATMTKPTALTGALDAGYGISTTLIGIGLVMAGIAVLRTACASGEPPAPGATAAAAGADLYQQSCASCHGTDLRGTDRGPSHLSQVYAPDHHPDAAFRAAVANGTRAHHWRFGDMAPVSGLSDDEVTAIVAYIREQQAARGFEPYPPR